MGRRGAKRDGERNGSDSEKRGATSSPDHKKDLGEPAGKRQRLHGFRKCVLARGQESHMVMVTMRGPNRVLLADFAIKQGPKFLILP